MCRERSLRRPGLRRRKVAADKGQGKAKEVQEKKSEREFRFRELVEELRD